MDNINFKKWAYYFTISVLIINIITFYLIANYVDFPGVENNTASTLFSLGILSAILLLMSFIFIIISSVKKEEKNYQYWVSVIGIVIFTVHPFLIN